MTELSDPHIREATAAARALRKQLGVPIDRPIEKDMLALVEEDLGIPVCVMEMPDGVAGAYLKKRGQHFIFLQATDFPTRQRFTLCHEVGHHVMNHKGRVEDSKDVGGKPVDPNEQQANYFASEFLHPVEAVKAWLVAKEIKELDLRTVVLAADHFHVSPPAMLYRLSKGDFGFTDYDLQGLWFKVKAKEHVDLAEQLGIGAGDDELAALEESKDWPRLPAALVDNAKAAHAVGFINDQRLDSVLRKRA
ncbi:MAG: ImmA/IrrE family metallo-endopeptidase [Thermoleophilaceae bacterium]|nr:ImmA/IrrE family metallo-endopeptidase [Thermoleophilaceae bacterium]